MADEQRTDDLQRARREAAELLGLDVERPLCPADALRVDLVCTLRLAIDDASASLIDGNSTDLARLINATESLIRLMPKHELPQPRRDDPRQRMWEIYSQMRQRGALAGEGYDGLQRENERLRAENAQLRAGTADEQQSVAAMDEAVRAGHALRLSRPPHERAAERSAVSPSPSLRNDVSPSPCPPAASAAPSPSTPQPPQACSAEESRRRMDIVNQPVPQHVRDTRPANEPWRDHVAGGAFHDRWRNNNW
jgi:hypothetical protein